MIAITDIRTPESIVRSIRDLGAEVLTVPSDRRLDPPVSAHPDMRMFIIEKKIFIPKESATELSHITKRLEEFGFETVPSSVTLSSEYPHDIAFNCMAVGNCLFGKLAFTAPEILSYATSIGMELVNVNQGYTKCSTLIVDSGSVITSDPSIAAACRAQGIDVLKIQSDDGDIILEGYSKGFIGGASGALGSRVFFLGDLSLHPEGARIKEFCEQKGKAAVSLGDQRLLDMGSLFLLDTE